MAVSKPDRLRSPRNLTAAEKRARIEARRREEMIARLAPIMPLYRTSPNRDVAGERAERRARPG
jgi:hypothetical protein